MPQASLRRRTDVRRVLIGLVGLVLLATAVGAAFAAPGVTVPDSPVGRQVS